MGLRRIAREYALQFIFKVDFSNDKITEDSLEKELKIFWNNFGSDLKPYGKEFTEELVKKTLMNKNKIDLFLKEVSENWKIERMATVDRNILRLGISEFLYFDDIDYDVTINEFIEIAKFKTVLNI